jgi:hypothetical protein
MDAGRRRHLAWRGGEPGRTRGFQLWVALPSDRELGSSESVYLAPEVISHDGLARVALDSYGSENLLLTCFDRRCFPFLKNAAKLSPDELNVWISAAICAATTLADFLDYYCCQPPPRAL